MKIYLYNTETGVYLGEDFADAASIKGGSYVIPEDATTIPPPEVEPGEVAVFRPDAGKWDVRRLDQEKVRISFILSQAIGY